MKSLTSTKVAVGNGLAGHDVLTADVVTSGDSYASRFSGPVGGWFLAVQARNAIELISDARPSCRSVLEVGGGHGQLTRPLLESGLRVVVHGSRAGCHERLRDVSGRIGRVASDLWHLPFADASFDLVVAIRLLAHVTAWRELLAELARVARSHVLIDFPARGAIHRLAPSLFDAKRHFEGDTRPYFDYTEREVTDGFLNLGLERAGVRRQFALPMVVHRVLRRPGLSRRLESVAAGLGVTRRVGSPVLYLARCR